MGPLSPPKARPQYFEIKGWHEDACAQVAVANRAEIEAARDVIALQADLLAARCEKLDEALRKAGIVDQALEKSKIRPQFDLAVTSSDQPSRQSWRKSGLEREPRKWEVALGSQTIIDWLSARAATDSTFVVSGRDFHTAPHEELRKRGFRVLEVRAGEGSRNISASGNPDRSRPEQGSLAQWFSETDQHSRAGISGYLLGRDTSTIDCELLRRRLHPEQFVCVELKSEAARHLSADWDGRIIEWQNHLLFIEPGLHYLDPVLIPPDRLGEIDWPKISVVTVSYNQADFLEDCLRSVLEQDYPNLEYIVVDAVSTDGSQDILRRYEPKLSRLIIEPDKGQSDGLNKGLNLATGDILTWINSDDMLAPGALRRAALAFLDYDCDLIAGGCERITKVSSEVTLRHHPALPYGRTVPLGFAEQYMWTNSWEKGDYFFQPEVLFTADIWRRSGGYLKLHLHWAMDWELWIRMGMAGATIAHIPEMLGRSRVHEAQKTTSEERYLHQLRNILLEHDHALSELEKVAPATLPAGSKPEWIQLHSQESAMQTLANLREPGQLRSAVKRRLPPRITHQLARLYGLRHSDRLRSAIKRRLPPRLAHQLARVYRLRHPAHLRSAIKHRLPPGVVRQLSRVYGLRHPERLRGAISRRLPPSLKDRLRQARRSMAYGLHGYSVISRVRLRELTRASEILAAAERDATASRALRVELETRIAQLQARCDELSEQCIALSDWRTMTTSLVPEVTGNVSQSADDSNTEIESCRRRLTELLEYYHTSRTREKTDLLELKLQQERTRGAAEGTRSETDAQATEPVFDSVANYATRLLFDRDTDPRTRHTISTLLTNGVSMQDALRNIAVQCYEEQSKPTYPQRRDLLARVVEMPKLAGAEELVDGYTIVDIGAEPLSFESHVYAGLIEHRPSLVIGFDPTDKDAPKTLQTGGQDGKQPTVIRTLPFFIGDGGPATFNLTRMQPTSSLHKPNLTIARRFSLLAEALEIVESSAVKTCRLDDILSTQDVSDKPIDFLKIDVQGATGSVLNAAEDTMARTLVCHVEAEFAELYEGETLFCNVDQKMRSLGFALMDFATLGRQRYNAFDATNERFFHAGRLLWADCVYVRNLDEPEKLGDAELLKLAEIAHVVYRKYDVAAFALQVLSQRTGSSFYDDYLKIWA